MVNIILFRTQIPRKIEMVIQRCSEKKMVIQRCSEKSSTEKCCKIPEETSVKESLLREVPGPQAQ